MLGMSNIFCEMYKWVVSMAPEEMVHATSDYPTMIDQHYDFKGRCLYFPISSKLCIELIPKDNKAGRYEQFKDGQFIMEDKGKAALINMFNFAICDRVLLMETNNLENIFGKQNFNDKQ